MNRIEIPLGKTKILFLLLGATCFVVGGTFFILNPEQFISPIARNPEVIRIGGIAGVLFFGAASVFGIKKLLEHSIGLAVDENGITDNTNASSIGLIKWSDIIEIKTEKVASTRFLLIYVSNPDQYLNKTKGFKRKLMEGNSRLYGTPLSITSNTLKYNFSELEKLIMDRLQEYRRNNV